MTPRGGGDYQPAPSRCHGNGEAGPGPGRRPGASSRSSGGGTGPGSPRAAAGRGSAAPGHPGPAEGASRSRRAAEPPPAPPLCGWIHHQNAGRRAPGFCSCFSLAHLFLPPNPSRAHGFSPTTLIKKKKNLPTKLQQRHAGKPQNLTKFVMTVCSGAALNRKGPFPDPARAAASAALFRGAQGGTMDSDSYPLTGANPIPAGSRHDSRQHLPRSEMLNTSKTSFF